MVKTLDMNLVATSVRRKTSQPSDDPARRLRVCTPASDWHQPNMEETGRLARLSVEDITGVYDRIRTNGDDARSVNAHISLIVVLRGGMLVELPYMKLEDFLVDHIPITDSMIDRAERELELQLPQDAGWVDVQAVLEAALDGVGGA